MVSTFYRSALSAVLLAGVTPAWGQVCLPGSQCNTSGGPPNVTTVGIQAPAGTVLTSVGTGASRATLSGGSESTQSSTEQAVEAVRKRRVQQTESVKDAPAPIEPNRLSAWTVGLADYERHSNVISGQSESVTRTTSSFGLFGGADIKFHALGIGEDGLLIGALAGYNSSYIRLGSGLPGAQLWGPIAGLYASYYKGPFSTDLLLKTDLFTLSDPALLPAANETNQNDYIIAQNFSYRLPWAQFWIEPTIGYRYLDIVYSGGGLPTTEGESWRIQGGLRVGEDAVSWNGVLVRWSLAALLYEDVSMSGFAADVDGVLESLSPVLPSDLNQLRVLGIAAVDFDYGNGASSYLELNARAGENVIGVGGKIGIRYRW